MSSKKKATAHKPAASKKGPQTVPSPRERESPVRAQHSEAYEASLKDYGEALELLRHGSWAQARDRFKAIQLGNPGEPVLAERAGTYARICERKLAAAEVEPRTAEGFYHLGVVRANEGMLDEAIRLLDRALSLEPGAASFLYARAAARALQGSSDAASADLRQAIARDPVLRYQAANDPDFEKIRDEAAFIDVIEPTPEAK